MVLTLLGLVPYTSISAQSSLDIDPAPLAKVLQDVVEAILRENYNEALSLCRKAADISLSKEFSYIHEKVYKSIERVINLLTQVEEQTLIDVEDNVKLYVLINDFYISKLELIESMNNYVNKLSSLFKDPATRYLITRTLTNYIVNLNTKLEIIISNLMQIYFGVYGQEIHIELNHQPIVYGGEILDLDIGILLTTNLSIDYVNITVLIIYGENMLSETIQYSIPIGKKISIKIETPKAEDIYAIGMKPSTRMESRLFVIARVVVDGRILIGYKFSNFTLMYLNPPIKVSIPSYVKPGEDIKVRISANLDTPLNLSIYLNNISNKSLIANLTISFGEYVLNISSANMSIGYLKLIFLTQPKGKYLAYSFSYTIAVVLENIVATINVKPFAFIPIAKPLLEIYVDSPTHYNVTIYFDNNVITRLSLVNNPKISVELSLPLTIFFWRYRILVEIHPNNLMYSPTVIESSIYVLNIVTLIIMTIFLAITITTPSRTSYIIAALRLGSSTMRNVIYKTRGIATIHTTIMEYFFRKPRLLNLYKKIIEIVSKYVEPPRASETLREFYRRLYESFSGYTSLLVKAFLELYEQDLYSNHGIDVDKAIRIVERIEEIESK
ncbi:MAG: hypothetical protein QW775_03680 [Ignisphaera sp.]|uniref:DUF4129 domain-containing protein n=1 Tax=Ignisphaera aggregans TaxID=334771 RepID=A0A7C4NN02_9CREN